MAIFKLQNLSLQSSRVESIAKQQDEKVQIRRHSQQNDQAVDHKGIQQCGMSFERIGAKSQSVES